MKQIEYTLKASNLVTASENKVDFLINMLEAFDFKLTVPENEDSKLHSFIKKYPGYFESKEVEVDENV